MRAFVEPLRELTGFAEMTDTAEKQKGLISITGCIDAQKPHMIYSFGNTKRNKVIVTFDELKAKELYEDYRFFDPDAVYYPAKDVLFYQSDIRGNVLTAERLNALKAIHEKEYVTLITTYDALMNTMAPAADMWENIMRLDTGDVIDLDEVVAGLIRMGYEKEYQVEAMGQFALRGGIAADRSDPARPAPPRWTVWPHARQRQNQKLSRPAHARPRSQPESWMRKSPAPRARR